MVSAEPGAITFDVKLLADPVPETSAQRSGASWAGSLRRCTNQHLARGGLIRSVLRRGIPISP
jgi:hypothetical protein